MPHCITVHVFHPLLSQLSKRVAFLQEEASSPAKNKKKKVSQNFLVVVNCVEEVMVSATYP